MKVINLNTLEVREVDPNQFIKRSMLDEFLAVEEVTTEEWLQIVSRFKEEVE